MRQRGVREVDVWLCSGFPGCEQTVPVPVDPCHPFGDRSGDPSAGTHSSFGQEKQAMASYAFPNTRKSEQQWSSSVASSGSAAAAVCAHGCVGAEGTSKWALKRKAEKERKRRAKEQPTEEAVTNRMIGADAESLVSRHDGTGRTRKDSAKNRFITVGSITALISALQAVYGQFLCPAALCSIREGNLRLRVCDCKSDVSHKSCHSKAHRLPPKSGPKQDKDNWKKVMAATDKALAALGRK